MIFDNIDFHNVAELEAGEKGYAMWRIPKALCRKLGKETGKHSTGIELRFKMKGTGADIVLCAEEEMEAQVAYIYYGSFQGGWQYSSKVIGTDKTVIHIERPGNMELLKQITRQQKLPFSPEVVRVLLPYGHVYYVGIEGEIEAPKSEDVPERTYLAYGSSITHGSLALAAPYTYPARIASCLGCDYLNMGFAGTAFLEEEMAEYIVSGKDWQFASVEMGINMVEDFPPEIFEERVDKFTQILAQDKRPVFATSIFGFNGGNQEKAEYMRKIVRKYAKDRLIFTEGLELLNNPAYISQDMVHPSLEGVQEISEKWSRVMRQSGSI